MSQLRTALKDYLTIRRQLGYKLRDEGSLLPKFIRFMEQQGASFITRDLRSAGQCNPKMFFQHGGPNG